MASQNKDRKEAMNKANEIYLELGVLLRMKAMQQNQDSAVYEAGRNVDKAFCAMKAVLWKAVEAPPAKTSSTKTEKKTITSINVPVSAPIVSYASAGSSTPINVGKNPPPTPTTTTQPQTSPIDYSTLKP